MTDRQYPADPAVDDKEKSLGGFAEIARQLDQRFPPAPGRQPISRQLVHKWWTKRHDNGFPEAVAVKGSANGGRGHHVFLFKDVADWYVLYRRTRLGGGAPITAQQERGEGPLAA